MHYKFARRKVGRTISLIFLIMILLGLIFSIMILLGAMFFDNEDFVKTIEKPFEMREIIETITTSLTT